MSYATVELRNSRATPRNIAHCTRTPTAGRSGERVAHALLCGSLRTGRCHVEMESFRAGDAGALRLVERELRDRRSAVRYGATAGRLQGSAPDGGRRLVR